MKELEVTLRVRNNRLKERRVQLGLSQRAMAAAAGLAMSYYAELEKLQRSPLDKNGAWTDAAMALAIYFEVPPEEMFPPSTIEVKQSTAVRKVDGQEARALVGMHQQRLLDAAADPEEAMDRVMMRREIEQHLHRLTERERFVLRRRFMDDVDLKTLGEEMGVCRGRPHQIESKALRKLRLAIGEEE